MLYLTDFSTASKRLNFNNPIQETDRFRSVGSGITLLLSVSKRRDMDTIWQKSVICYIRALRIFQVRQNVCPVDLRPKWRGMFLQFSTFNYQFSTFIFQLSLLTSS